MAGLNKYQGLAEGALTKASNTFGSLADNPPGEFGDAGIAAGMTDTTGGYAAPGTLGVVNTASTWKPDYASEAGVNAAQAAEQGRETMQRGLSRMGINPNSGRFAGLNQEYELAAAAAKAGAKSKATREESQDWIRNLLSAAQLGISNANQASSAALQQQNRDDQIRQQQVQNQAASAGGLMSTAGEFGSLAAGKAEADAAAADSLQAKVDALFGSPSPGDAPRLQRTMSQYRTI